MSGASKRTLEKFSRSKNVSEPTLSQKFSPLRRLRERYRLSQREFAEKCGISRGRLRRLENHEKFDNTTYGELQRISEALGIEIKELLFESFLRVPEPFLRRAGEYPFEWEKPTLGYKLVSFLPAGQDFFAGKLFILPQKSLPSGELPRANFIFIQMLLGIFQVVLGGETHEIKEGDSLLFRGNILYFIQNPTARDAVAFVFASTSRRAL